MPPREPVGSGCNRVHKFKHRPPSEGKRYRSPKPLHNRDCHRHTSPSLHNPESPSAKNLWVTRAPSVCALAHTCGHMHSHVDCVRGDVAACTAAVCASAAVNIVSRRRPHGARGQAASAIPSRCHLDTHHEHIHACVGQNGSGRTPSHKDCVSHVRTRARLCGSA